MAVSCAGDIRHYTIIASLCRCRDEAQERGLAIISLSSALIGLVIADRKLMFDVKFYRLVL